MYNINDSVAGVRPDFKIEFNLGDSFIKILEINKTSTTHAAKHETHMNGATI